jgi:hypothetical protein
MRNEMLLLEVPSISEGILVVRSSGDSDDNSK